MCPGRYDSVTIEEKWKTVMIIHPSRQSRSDGGCGVEKPFELQVHYVPERTFRLHRIQHTVRILSAVDNLKWKDQTEL
jgi:hypothetical protein